MAKKLATLYIDDSSIRLLVVNGERVKTWGTVKLEPGLVEGLIVSDPSKLGGIITQLFKEHKVRMRQFAIGVSAMHSLTRQIVMPVLPRPLLVEAVQREAGRLLPLPLEQLYLSWQTVPAPEGKTHVFLSALRRSSLDSIFQALKIAKVKATSLSIKPLAIARLIKNPNAILVDVQSNEFDIVVLVDGVPLPSRTVSFPSDSLTWQEKSVFVTDELARTLQFYADNNPDRPLAPDIPMFVSGDLVTQTELRNKLFANSTFPLQTVDTSLEYPEGFDKQRFMVNSGLFEGYRTFITTPSGMNLLPEEHRIKPVNWTRVALVPAVATLVVIVALMAALIGVTEANVISSRNQLAVANKTLQERQSQKQKLNIDTKKLQQTLTSLNTTLEACKTLTTSLSASAATTNDDLSTVNGNAPQSAFLTSLNMSSDVLMVNGICPDKSEILAYARRLDDSGRFSETIVSHITLEDGTYSFLFTLKK